MHHIRIQPRERWMALDQLSRYYGVSALHMRHAFGNRLPTYAAYRALLAFIVWSK